MNENTKKELSQNNNIYKINDTYTILFNKKIGGGAFGKIYSCINNKTKEIYACKIEKPDIENPQLGNEYRILSLLKNYDYFPKCFKYCNSQYGYILILERLGSNLGVIMSKLPNKKFSMKSALMIINQSLERLKLIHEKGIIHRDMKPENLCIGYKGKEKNIYLIDFGLSKIINNDKKNLYLLNIKKEKIVIGTVRYISMNAHLGNEQYKKDDLESLAYMMIYFIKGELPWQNLKAKSRKEKYTKIYQKKKHTVNTELCNFLPDEIKTFLSYILNLNQKQNPDYNKLMNLINNLMKKYGYTNDSQFEWYSSSFLQQLYNSPITDEEDQIKSSSIYEEDDSVKSEKNKTRNKNKKNLVSTNTNTNYNNIKKFSNIINNMNEFDLIYNKNIISTKEIKQKISLDKNNNNQNKLNNITNAIDNYVNNEVCKRKRLSSYG
jgi:casein kinase 1